MDVNFVRSVVETVIREVQNQKGEGKIIPIGVSARHVHLSKQHMRILFGPQAILTKKKDLSQPGQFAANETVTIVGPKGSIERVRILGPARTLTQVEISQTDAVKLGLSPPVRQSGDIKGSSPCTIVGPAGSVYVEEGCIIAQTHIHMSPEDAKFFQVKNNDFVKVSIKSSRSICFERVLIRVSDRYRLEMHIDTDEANAALIKTGDEGILSLL